MPSRNRIHISAPPERVFAALSEPQNYGEWVVGASRIRDADPSFPAVGSKLYHRVGLGPLSIADESEVLELEPGRRLVLDARIRPIGKARVELDISPAENGSRVLMVEGPGDSWSRITMGGPLAEPLLKLRNDESLSRLKRIVERGGERKDQRSASPAPAGRRRVLVTGASSGIGLATARAFARAGDSVALVARGEQGLEQARTQLTATTGRVTTHPADIAERVELEAAIDAAAAAHGGLDVVVAAAASAVFGPFTDTDPELVDDTVRTVLIGTMNTVRAVLPHLEESSGVVVIVGSVAGRVPGPQLAAYSAAKHGLVGFIESLRAELADEGSPVRLSIVQPWAVDTPLPDNFTSATGLLPPVDMKAQTPEAVADEIVECAERPRDVVTLGGRARLAIAAHTFLRPLANAALILVSRHLRAGGDRPTEAAGGLAGSTGRGETDGPLSSRATLGGRVARWRRDLRRSRGRR